MSEPRYSLREIASFSWMDLSLCREAMEGGPGAAATYDHALFSLMRLLKVDQTEATRLINEIVDRDAFDRYVEGRRALLVPKE